VFSVTRTGSTQWPLLVFYSISGTASNGVDYRPLSGRVLIPDGALSANIVVETIDDNLVEGTESVLQARTAPILTPTNTAPQWWYASAAIRNSLFYSRQRQRADQSAAADRHRTRRRRRVCRWWMCGWSPLMILMGGAHNI
jgi:hypothetical protein